MLKAEPESWRAVENASEQVKCVYPAPFLSHTRLLLTAAGASLSQGSTMDLVNALFLAGNPPAADFSER